MAGDQGKSKLDDGQTPVKPGAALAILIYLLSLLLFDLMGLIIKHLSPHYEATELSAYRNVFGLIPAFAVLWTSRAWHQAGRKVIIRQWPLAMARGLIVAMAQLMFYLALARIAFATATTISYSNAFFMTAFAVPILGERVGPLRWSAVAIGGMGVLIVTGLGDDAFTWDALLPIGAAAFYALAGVTSRLMDDDVPSALINIYSTVFALIGSVIVVGLTGGFSTIGSAQELVWIVAMGLFGGSAVLCLVVAFRMTEQSTLAPFSYFGIPLAFLLGWLFFNETPLDDLFPGALLIAAAGLMIVWRERRLKAG